MAIRERTELLEEQILSPFATLAKQTKGRQRPEQECDIRTAFQRDRDRIIHSKSFRRLKHKTQVFLSPEGDHYRTRLTHTLEVAQIARTVARALRMNEDLTEAIAVGHDLGHTPFGHAGERALREVSPLNFNHNEQSVRVVERLEKNNQGLNLTFEVRDGILCHTGPKLADTPEGRIVRFADRIAYINHDIDDAIRAKLFVEEDLPREYTDVLGRSVRDRLNNMIRDIIGNSLDKPQIIMSPDMEKAMQGLRGWMFDNVYTGGLAKAEEGKAQQLIQALYEYYMDHTDQMPVEYRRMFESGKEKNGRVVCDYIAGMSDGYAIDRFEELFVPKAWKAH